MKSEDRVRFLSWSSPGTSCTLALFWQGKSPNIDGFKLLHICSESESFLRKSNCSSGIKVGLQTEERYRAGLIGGRGWINVDELGMRKILSVQLPNRSALVERSGWSLIAWTSAKSNLNHCFKERRVVQRRRSTKHATISKFRRSEERKRDRRENETMIQTGSRRVDVTSQRQTSCWPHWRHVENVRATAMTYCKISAF